MEEACSAILQRGSPEKLQYLGSVSIPCYIGNWKIERALYDLGASMSLMPLSISQKLKLPDLHPTTMVIKRADGSTRHPAGVLEDIPVHVGNFVIPCDFIVLDMDETSHAPVILGRSFLVTTAAVIDVQGGTLSFYLCGERVDFCFPPPTPSPLPAIHAPPETPVHTIPPNNVPGTTVFDGDGGSSMWPTVLHNVPPPIPTSFGITYVCTAKVGYPTPSFYTSTGTPPG